MRASACLHALECTSARGQDDTMVAAGLRLDTNSILGLPGQRRQLKIESHLLFQAREGQRGHLKTI